MSNYPLVPTDKPQLSAYISPGFKQVFEKLGGIQERSNSRYLVYLMKREMVAAVREGLLKAEEVYCLEEFAGEEIPDSIKD